MNSEFKYSPFIVSLLTGSLESMNGLSYPGQGGSVFLFFLLKWCNLVQNSRRDIIEINISSPFSEGHISTVGKMKNQTAEVCCNKNGRVTRVQLLLVWLSITVSKIMHLWSVTLNISALILQDQPHGRPVGKVSSQGIVWAAHMNVEIILVPGLGSYVGITMESRSENLHGKPETDLCI